MQSLSFGDKVTFGIFVFISLIMAFCTSMTFCEDGEVSRNEKELLAQLQTEPDNDSLRMTVAKIYLDKGKQADAIEVIEQGLYGRNSFRLHFELCPLYLDIDRPNRAIIHAKEAVRLRPDHAIAVFNLGLAYGRKGLTRDAIEMFHRAIELDGEKPEYYYNLGVAYYTITDYDKALDFYRKTIELDPQDARAYFNTGTIYNILDKKDKAISYLEKALDILGPFTPAGEKTIEFIREIRNRQ